MLYRRAEPETLAEARRADRVSRRVRQLASAYQAEQDARSTIANIVAGLRRDGVSWQRIGVVLGMTRQAAQQRFDKRR